ncbi:RNA-binding S4 domain-containing protein [Burkholderiales bacterium]|nr:RNA-binding S4 domain-containing protein [Burkholderiales bacterium]
MNDDKPVRIDKWLWAARFYKTRTLAASAINNGRIKLNGARIKPSKQVKISDTLVIQSNPFTWDIQVISLAERRVSAVLAKTLYEESTESMNEREKLTATLKLEKKQQIPIPKGRPTKRDREQIIRFKQKDN